MLELINQHSLFHLSQLFSSIASCSVLYKVVLAVHYIYQSVHIKVCWTQMYEFKWLLLFMSVDKKIKTLYAHTHPCLPFHWFLAQILHSLFSFFFIWNWFRLSLWIRYFYKHRDHVTRLSWKRRLCVLDPVCLPYRREILDILSWFVVMVIVLVEW